MLVSDMSNVHGHSMLVSVMSNVHGHSMLVSVMSNVHGDIAFNAGSVLACPMYTGREQSMLVLTLPKFTGREQSIRLVFFCFFVVVVFFVFDMTKVQGERASSQC